MLEMIPENRPNIEFVPDFKIAYDGHQFPRPFRQSVPVREVRYKERIGAKRIEDGFL